MIILVVIAIPSFKLIYYMDKTKHAEMTIKVVGHQWYWEYGYPEHNINFDSNLISDKDLKPGQIRLLEVDNRVVLPINTDVQVLITAADVIHSWAIPALGIKTDAVPGRTNETWLNITKPGVYYGQCSELCGIGHGFMPIAIEAKTKEEYKAWLEQAKVKFATIPQILTYNRYIPVTIHQYMTHPKVVIPEARFYEARNEPIKPAIWNPGPQK
jgi:cytochrome c oxidase subunit 2